MRGEPVLCPFCSPIVFSVFRYHAAKGTSLGRTDLAPGRPGIFKDPAAVGAGSMCVFFLLYLTPTLSDSLSSLTLRLSKSPLDLGVQLPKHLQSPEEA